MVYKKYNKSKDKPKNKSKNSSKNRSKNRSRNTSRNKNNKINNKIKKFKSINKKNIIKHLIAGAFSPVSASKKIQSITRGRLVRQTKKAEYLKSSFSLGATKYRHILVTKDFSGINLSNQMLSRRVLSESKFKNVNFKNCKINGAKLNNINAEGANFTSAELKKSESTNGNYKNAIFINTNLSKFNSDTCIYSDCRFASIDFREANFKYDDFKNCTFANSDFNNTKFFNCNFANSKFKYSAYVNPDALLDYCVIENLTLENFPNLFRCIKTPIDRTTGETGIIRGLTIINPNPNGIHESSAIRTSEKALFDTHNDCTHKNIIFYDLIIYNILFRDNVIFDNCDFNRLKLGNTDDTRVQFHKSKFKSCRFSDCDFGSFIGHSCSYHNSEFINCDLNKCDLRAGIFTSCKFNNCNLDGVKFVGSYLNGVKFTNNTILSNIDFQECDGMEGMNFQGLNLQGSRLVGITDPGLEGCNFRDANLRGVQFDFSQVHGSDFTGADLTGSNVRVAEGSNETIGIPDDHEEGRTVDTHKTFYNIRVNALVDFYKSKTGKTDRDVPAVNKDLIKNTLSTLLQCLGKVDKSRDELEELTRKLIECFAQRLNGYDFSKVVAGSDPIIDFKTLIYFAMQYLVIQPDEFKSIYIVSFILDSTEAYGPGGLSCAAGMVERLITVMEQPASVVKDSVASKLEEYTELMNIITNDIKALIKRYQQEWFEYHREGGPHSFAKSVALDTIMADYKDFLEKKFDYANLRGAEKERVRVAIQDNPDAGTKITREYIESSVLFFGGRVKDNRHLNYFKMLKDRFYIKKSVRQSHTRKKKRPRRRHRTRVHRTRVRRTRQHRSRK